LDRQRSELSDYMSEDQASEEYRAVITQVGKGRCCRLVRQPHFPPARH
jgi:hypothetical protein